MSTKDKSVKVGKVQYQRLVGKLIYLAHTRPDLAYVVSVVSQSIHDPRARHLGCRSCPGISQNHSGERALVQERWKSEYGGLY